MTLKKSCSLVQEDLVPASLKRLLFEDFLTQQYLGFLECDSLEKKGSSDNDHSGWKRAANKRSERRVARIDHSNNRKITAEIKEGASQSISLIPRRRTLNGWALAAGKYQVCLWCHRKIGRGSCCVWRNDRIGDWGLEKSRLFQWISFLAPSCR